MAEDKLFNFNKGLSNLSDLNDFSSSTSTQIKVMCKELFEQYQISSFSYAKFYRDGTTLSVHSNPGYANLFLKLECPPIAPIPIEFWQLQSFYYLPKTIDDIAYQKLVLKSCEFFNEDNPLYYITQHPDYIDVAVIASNLGDNNAINRFLNSLSEIKLFIELFKKASSPLFEQGYDQRIYLPSHMSPQIPKYQIFGTASSCQYNEFVKRLNMKQCLDNHSKKRLSVREKQCLYYLCKGYSYKGIANELMLCFRTVQDYIDNAKDKLNLFTKAELVKYLLDVQVF